jgi:toxin YoeB
MPSRPSEDPSARRRQPRRAVLISEDCLDDLEHWAETDRAVHRRLLRIIRETLRDPFAGIGKPEPLRFELQGCWSRRLTDEDRVVYVVGDEHVQFLSARKHYPRSR